MLYKRTFNQNLSHFICHNANGKINQFWWSQEPMHNWTIWSWKPCPGSFYFPSWEARHQVRTYCQPHFLQFLYGRLHRKSENKNYATVFQMVRGDYFLLVNDVHLPSKRKKLDFLMCVQQSPISKPFLR